MQTLVFPAMGCTMTALLDSDGAAGRSALGRVPGWFEEWEAALSRFRPDSELNRLTGGEAARAGETLLAVVEESIRAAEATGGLVNPLVREALAAAGYDRTFELVRDGAAAAGGTPAPMPDWRGIVCDPVGRTIRLPDGARLDLGGIAKGWAADRAAERLGAEGPALVEAGGDIAASGPRADGSPWPVGVFNPFSAGEPLVTLALEAGGVATSGRDYRQWTAGGVSRHHIIDPRTGESARTDVLTATVVAPTARRAEAAAKAALILGAAAGIRWLESQPELAAMLVREDRGIAYTQNFAHCVWP